jgi:hypothetical protein
MLTETTRKALLHLQGVEYAIPSEIGMACGGTKRNTAQGLGRFGGGVAARLCKDGLVEDCSWKRNGHPAYRITKAGRDALARNK